MKKLLLIMLLAFVVFPTRVLAALPGAGNGASADSGNREAATESLALLANKDFWFNLILGFIALVGTLVIAKTARVKIAHLIEDKMGADQSGDVSGVILRTVTLFIYFFGISITLTLWGLDLTFLIGGIGIGLGFTMQTFLSNFIAGIIMIFGGEYKTGTWVEIQGKTGFIMKISSLFTSIKQFNGVIAYVPNVKFLQEEVECFNVNTSRRLEIDLGVDYDADLTKAKMIINKILESFPKILKAPAPFITVDKLGENGIELKVFVWISVEDNGLEISSNITETINHAFIKSGIQRKQNHLVIEKYEKEV